VTEGYTVLVDFAVAGKTVHGLEEGLSVEGGSELDQHMALFFPADPPRVGHPRGDDHARSRP